MSTFRYVEWLLSAVFGFILVTLIKAKAEKIFKGWLRIPLFFIEFFLMMTMAYLLIAVDSLISWKFHYPFSGIYIALLAECLSDVLFYLISLVSKKKESSFRLIVSIIVMICVFSYGTINMETIKGNRLSYSSDKLKHDYTIIFIADLHYGSAQSQNIVAETLDEIRKLSPDYLILGGDITDEYTTKEEMEWIYEQLSDLGMPVYYVYGNHDRQDSSHYIKTRNYSEKELEDTIIKNGITILEDEYIILNDDLIVLGREDSNKEERKEVGSLKPWPKDHYVICVDHSPYQTDDIIKTKADLQLSGHTHAGQYFPLKTLYTLAGLNVYGNYRIEDTDLYVSSGISGWYSPFRNEEGCHYEIINLSKKMN